MIRNSIRKNLWWLIFLSFFYCNNGFSIQNNQEYVKGEILVKFKSGTTSICKRQLHVSNKVEVINEITSLGIQRLKLSANMEVEEGIKIYGDNSSVEYAQPNYIYHLCKTPDDTGFNELWGLHNTGQTVNSITGTTDADIDAPEAWDLDTGSESVVVAVIDTGTQLDHEDLVDNLWVNADETDDNSIDDDGNGYIDDYYGYDFYNDDDDPSDDHGHGSHVAGTIGAKGDNSKGVAGVSWKVSIMSLKTFNSLGLGDTNSILEAIIYAKNNGAKIVNCSFSLGSADFAVKEAIGDATGLLFVCAAGNGGDDNMGPGWDVDVSGQEIYPVCFDLDNIIGVASTDQDDNLSGFSNYGTTSVDVAAPGGDSSTYNIYSTYYGATDAYDYLGGTSMAAPHVSGLAALMLSRKSSLAVSDLKSKIINGVDVLDSLESKVASGGRINAYSSLSGVGAGSSTTEEEEDKNIFGHSDLSSVCFIAIATYGTPSAKEVRILCKFRDKYLLTNKFGRAFVCFYYKYSPYIAHYISDKESLKTITRIVLTPFIWLSENIID